MLSKNNKKLQTEKMEPKHQRFAIKKFTVGVASVLIGTTFAISMGTTLVSADETSAQVTEVASDSVAENTSEDEEGTLEKSTSETTEVTSETDPATVAETPQETSPETSEVKADPTADQAQVTEEMSQTRPTAGETTEIQTEDQTSKAPDQIKEEATSAFRSVPEATAETTAETPAETTKDPQWPAAADTAVTNDNGIYTPQISYNGKYWTFQANPGMITDEVAKSNTIPFSMAEHRTGGTVVTSRDYKIRLQLDKRLVDSISEISLTQRDDTNKTFIFKRVLDDAGNETNIWEATLLDIFNEPVVGYAYLAENGRIMLNDTVQNVLNKIPNVAQEPLLYNAYVYDASSKTALLATNNEGYIVGPSDPLSEKQVTPTYSEDKEGTKFIGSHNVISYDSTIGENGALVVFYQASKKGKWTDGTGLVFNYGIDPALLPYLEKTGDTYTVELDKVKNGDQYGFVKDKTSKLWVPLSYADTTKVADLALNADGTGSYAPANINDAIQFGGFASEARPVALRLVYRLNQKPEEIYASLQKDGKAGGSLLFNNYFTDANGVIQNYSLASNLIAFDDSDGDGIPDLKERADLTNPLVSMPNISNVYVSENKVHGEVVFNQAEGTKQLITVTDEKGTDYGSTTVTPERFDGTAKAQKFDVTLTKALPAVGTKLIVSVNTVISSGDSVSNNLPQTNEVTIKEGPIAKTDLKYYSGASVKDDAKNAISNTASFPENATYTWITKPDTTKKGNSSGQVKVSFPDEFDPNYTHELFVTVPVAVEDVDLTKSKIEFNKPVLHVNQDIDEVNGLLTKEYVENSLIKKLTLANGTVYEGEELKDLLNAVVAEYSWGDDPDVSVASDDVAARLRARLNNKRSVTWDMMIDVIGAEAKTDIETPWGVAVDAATAIANVDELKQFDTADKPVSYAWKTEPDFRPGVGTDHNVTGVVVVTYPDGTTQDVSVPIMVGDSQADTFATKDETTTVQKITVHYGQTVDPMLGIVDPAGNNVVKADFESPIDTSVASDEKRSAVMTFADGSSVPVNIPVEVIVATPKADVTTPWGQVPDAKSLIANTDVLAQFDQTDKPVAYTWKQEPDVRPATGATDRNATGIVTVTYPDGTTQDVEVTVVVDKSEADKFMEDQGVKTQTVTVKRGQTVAPSTAFDGLTETVKTDLKATGATFNDQIDTSAATKKDYPATVTFADGSTASVDIPVVVTEQAQEYDPVGKDIETGLNTLPTAGSAIDVTASALPAGTTYAWKQAPDVTTKGVKDAVVVVTYPDGSTDDVSVKVTVTAQNDEFAVAYPSTSVVENDAVTLTPTITDKNGAVTTPPAGTKFTLKDTDQHVQIDENTGVITVTNAPLDLSIPDVVVTYPDGTTTTLTPDLTVYQQPVAGEARFDLNGPVTAEKAKEAIKNSTDLPEDATYEWKTIPDTSNPGFSSNVVSVTYPNGTVKDVTVSVRVGTDAEIYQPSGRNIQVDLNGTMPEASDVTTNMDQLPEGTVVTWKDPVDTTTPGYKKGTVVVTYPDGTADEMVLQVKVGTDTEIYDPTVQEIQTPINGDLNPEDGILNFYDLPSRTVATWKEPVDTTTPGHKEGTVILTYPDGTTDEVVVPVKVGTDAQIYEPQAKEVQVDLNGTPEATAGIENLSELPTGTTVVWKAPVDTTTPGHKEGTVVVTYPDGTTDEVVVPVKVGTDEQIYTPTGQEVKTQVGSTPEATEGIANLSELPTGTTVAWKEPVDTATPGHKEGTVVVTYPDGTTEEVTVPVKVGTDEQIYEPQAKEVQVDLNGTPEATAGIENLSDLPTGTTVAWKAPVDTTTPGHKEGTVVVTYPDGTTEEVTVPVKVGTDAQINEPQAKEVQVDLNGIPEATAGIENLSELPTGTTVAWKASVDTTTPGHKEGTVVVTYPDGTTEEVTVPVKVGTDEQIYEPQAKEVQVDLNGTPEATAGIENLSELPTGTTVAWKEPVDTTTPGHKEGTVVVTYPDGTTEEVIVPVKVGTDTEIYTPTGQEVKTPVGEDPEAKAGISNLADLPDGTTVSWKEPVDVTTPGHKEGTVVVTYPDGTTDEVVVPVKVGTDAQINEPISQEIKVPIDSDPDAKEGIQNMDDLPTGTTVAWKEPVDVTTPGHKEGTVVVTYPDGTTEEVTVPVKVGTDAQINEPISQEIKAPIGSAPDAKEGIQNMDDLPTGTTVSWKEPVDTTTPGTKEGTVVVTYPDGTTEEVTVPVKVGTDTEIYTPTGQEVKTPVGEDPEAKAGISNLADLPEGTTVSWKEPVDVTTPGHKEGTVVVTYPDGTTDEVVVPVKVGTDAQINEPQAKEVQVDLNGTPEATAGIGNLSELPTGTTVAWKTPVDTTMPGHKEGTVVVTYPDGTTEEVTVPVKVGTDAQINEPISQEIKAPIGSAPDAKEGIQNMDDLPTGTIVAWKEPVDTTTPGHKEGTVVVTYPDGTTEEVTVPVKVGTDTEIYTPTGQEVKTPVGEDPEAKAGISNLADLPDGTTVSWKEPVDVTTPGHKEGTVVVTYPDGTTDEVVVPVKVGTDAQINEPKIQEIKTPVGEEPDAKTGISNVADLPDGTTVSWKEPVDTTTPGYKEGTIVVTYPDGTTEEVKVPIKVGTDAQIYTPISQEVKTQVGSTPAATEGIANLSELPDGTTVAWKEPVDTTTLGHKEGTIVVTYPDGTTEEVAVSIKVGTDADLYTPVGQEVKTPVGVMPDAKTGIANLSELPEGTTIAWKEPIDSTTPGHKEGTIVVTYPDGTTEEVIVSIKVGTDADLYTPLVKEVKTPVGETPDAKTGISNLNELPTGTIVEWKVPIDTTTPGYKDGVLVVTYPDGSTKEIAVTVKVGTDAQINDPIARPITSEVGKLPVPSEMITNLDKLPAGTVVTWNVEPNVSEIGTVNVSLLVTYPDGSSEVVETQLNIIASGTTVGGVAKEEITEQSKRKTSATDMTTKAVNTTKETTKSTDTETKAAELPQTGDADNQKASALGILSLLAGFLGIATKRKKRDEE